MFPASRYPSADPKSAGVVAAEFLEWQQSLGTRPFFAFLNLYDTHRPYHSPPHFEQMFGDTSQLMNRYDGAISYVDHTVSRLLDSLSARRQLENTVVIITSDHGELFGEHREWEHGGNLYLPVLHVPLMFRFPRAMPSGMRVPNAVTTTDLAATILELAGDSTPGVGGRSLSCYWAASPPAPQLSLAEVRGIGLPEWSDDRRPTYSVTYDHWHYIRKTDGTELLFDYFADSAEANNLAKAATMEALMTRFRETVVGGELPGKLCTPAEVSRPSAR